MGAMMAVQQEAKVMKINLRAAILVGAISALTIFPAMAAQDDKPPKDKPSVGAPGPIAGAGLAFLAAGGGYLVLRYRKRKTGTRPE
jgi:hypothetical protein